MLELASKHIPEVTALAAVILTAILNRLLRMKAKLQYSIASAPSLLVEEPLLDAEGNKLQEVQIVHSASIYVKNAGLLPAKAAEVTFNWRPPIFNLFPARAFRTETYALNRFSVHFDSLAPGESVTIHIMSINRDLPLLTAVRAENCVGVPIPIAPMQLRPKWLLAACWVLLILGGATLVYLATASVERLAEISRSQGDAAAARRSEQPIATATMTITTAPITQR